VTRLAPYLHYVRRERSFHGTLGDHSYSFGHCALLRVWRSTRTSVSTRKYGSSTFLYVPDPDPADIRQLAIQRRVQCSRKASAYVCRQYRPGWHRGHQRAPCRRFKLFRPINHHKLHEYCDREKYISHLRDYRRTGDYFHREFLRPRLQRDIQDQRRM
jgi:hypothetical protein